MDVDMNEFYLSETCSSLEEFDPNYEFEAPRYYDFSRTETTWEVEEAERWFHSAGTYPPSPFVAKMNWGKGLYVGAQEMHIEEEDQEHVNSISNDTGCRIGPETPALVHCGVEETRMLPEKSAVKTTSARNSTLMKPTASHLAKQHTCQEVQFNRMLRSQEFPTKDQETASQHSSIIENYATKRQKLEVGFLQKAADLKHRTVLPHKLSEKVYENVHLPHTGLKVTVPREPRLQTARRAQIHRSKHTAKTADCTRSNIYSLKLQNLNHKIQVCRPKKVTAELPEFQIVDTRNHVPASQSRETELKRPMPNEATKLEKCKAKHGLRAGLTDEELHHSTSKHDLPITLFHKLTLEPGAGKKLKFHSKCSRESAPSIQQAQEVLTDISKGEITNGVI